MRRPSPPERDIKSVENKNMSGFGALGFAESLGTVVRLDNTQGMALNRSIGVSGYHDLINPYPVFICSDFSNIRSDFAQLKQTKAVCLTLRTDVFDENIVLKTEGTWDWFKPFKTHYITNFREPWRQTAARNAIRYEKRARDIYAFSRVENPASYATELSRLNKVILDRTQIGKTTALSVNTLQIQMSQNGVRLFKAENCDGVQGLALFMITDQKAYAYLLGATNEARSDHVIYGLYGYALDSLKSEVEVVDFGGNPGWSDDPADNVVQFKKLWTNQIATSFICGKIFDRNVYAQLCAKNRSSRSKFFPSYRAK